jgi:hypothetical protein
VKKSIGCFPWLIAEVYLVRQAIRVDDFQDGDTDNSATIHGGSGDDTVTLAGSESDYTVSLEDGNAIRIAEDVEQIRFESA